MRSLVTGSSGLLGKCLVEQLEGRGDTLELVDIEPVPGDSPHRFHRADVSQAGSLDTAADGVEVIYHLAAAQRMKPQFASWSESEIFTRNLEAVRVVLETARAKRVSRVVFISSSGVYGVPQKLPCGEDHPTVPLGEYGRSKLLAEELCMQAIEDGLDVTIFRPMSLFAPGMTGIFVMLFEWVRTGAPVFMLGSGRNRVQASAASDIANACVLAANAPKPCNGIMNLASDPDSVPTVEGMVRGLVEHAGSGSPLVKIPASLLRTAARALGAVGLSPIVPEHYILADTDFVLDIGRAKAELGWQPRYDNIEMMCQAYDSYLSAGPDARPKPHPVLRILDAVVPHRPPQA